MVLKSVKKKKRPPIRESVYGHLKTDILSGHLDPGEKLTEEHLAKTLGVSRTPIREALYKLESEGLIKPRNKRGFIVSGDSREEVEELFELRSILEGYALRVISQTISEETLKQLRDFIQNAEEALKKNKIEEVFKWNTQFHDLLHALIIEKARLHDLIVDIRKNVLRHRKDTLRYPDGVRRSVEGHKKIVIALQLKDPDLSERVMREHIQEAREDALRALFGKP
ncbi:MAG: GntR family transcriptional regulator [Deltaproteobacteria bacterium]|nr:GntR family transcriptional regulator [Deltaproteobacteria bacterium]